MQNIPVSYGSDRLGVIQLGAFEFRLESLGFAVLRRYRGVVSNEARWALHPTENRLRGSHGSHVTTRVGVMRIGARWNTLSYIISYDVSSGVAECGDDLFTETELNVGVWDTEDP